MILERFINEVQRAKIQRKDWNIFTMYQIIPKTQGLEDKGIFLGHATLPSRLGREKIWMQ